MGRKDKAQAPPKSVAVPAADLPAWVRSATPLVLIVHAKPGSKVAAIVGLSDGVEVSIDAPAKEGEANAALLEFLAAVLGVRRRDVALVAGGRSREKLVTVDGLTVDAAADRLFAALAA